MPSGGSVAEGNDAEALACLQAAWHNRSDAGIGGVLVEIGRRRGTLNALRKSMPRLDGDVERICRFVTWLEEAPPIHLATCLRVEAAGMTGRLQASGCLGRCFQARAMEAWTELYDATDGFGAPIATISGELIRIADRPGYSRMFLELGFSVLAQGIEGIPRVEKQRAAVLADFRALTA